MLLIAQPPEYLIGHCRPLDIGGKGGGRNDGHSICGRFLKKPIFDSFVLNSGLQIKNGKEAITVI